MHMKIMIALLLLIIECEQRWRREKETSEQLR